MNNTTFTTETTNGTRRTNQLVSPYNIWGDGVRLEADYFTLENGVEVNVTEAIFVFTKFSYGIDKDKMVDEIGAMEDLRIIINAIKLARDYDDVNPENNIDAETATSLINTIKTLVCEHLYAMGSTNIWDEIPAVLDQIKFKEWYYGFTDPYERINKLTEGSCDPLVLTFYLVDAARSIMKDFFDGLYFESMNKEYELIQEMLKKIKNSEPIRRSFVELGGKQVHYYNEWADESISLDCMKETTYTREKVHVEVCDDSILITSLESGSVLYDLKVGDDFVIDNQMRNWYVIKDNGLIRFVKYRNNNKIMESVTPKTGDWLMARTSGACRNGMFHKVKPIPLKVHFNDYEPEWYTDEMTDTGLTINGYPVYKLTDRFDTQHYIKFDGLMQRVSTFHQSRALIDGSKEQQKWIDWFDKADWKSADGKYALVGRQLYIKGK